MNWQCTYSHWRIIARSLTLALDPNIRLWSCLLAVLPHTLDRQGTHWVDINQGGKRLFRELVPALTVLFRCLTVSWTFLFGFCIDSCQVYITTDSTTSPVLGGKRRAWQLEGVAQKCEQGGRKDCYLTGMIRGWGSACSHATAGACLPKG